MEMDIVHIDILPKHRIFGHLRRARSITMQKERVQVFAGALQNRPDRFRDLYTYHARLTRLFTSRLPRAGIRTDGNKFVVHDLIFQ